MEDKIMKKRVILSVTLLLICGLIPLQKVSAKLTLTVSGGSAKTTTTTDTDDITFNVNVLYTGDGIGIITLSAPVVGPAGNTLRLGLAKVGTSPRYANIQLNLNKNASQDILITAPRWTTQPTHGFKQVGTYNITFTAAFGLAVDVNGNPIDLVSFTATTSLTLTVQEPSAEPSQPPRITVFSIDGLTRRSTTGNVGDITYNFLISNDGGESDTVAMSTRGDVSTASISPNNFSLEPKASEDVILTLPRAELSEAGLYIVAVDVESESEDDIVATIVTETTITPLPNQQPPSNPTNPTQSTEPTEPDLSTHKVFFSEFMFEAGGGETPLPQWIEVYNGSDSTVNLNGWKLQWNSLQPTPVEVTTTLDADFHIPAQQARLIVTALGRYSGSNLSNTTVYQLRSEKIAEGLIIEDIQDITGGFSLKLMNPADELIDHIGTLSGDKKTWELPETLIEGVRSSLIRRFDEVVPLSGVGVPRSGIKRRGWIRAIDTKRLIVGLYYGSPHDLGTPGYRRGKPLPVELSQFSAKFVKDEVVINWTTESELDNAGFNIYRSTSRTKDFQRINTKLIQGAGTTGQRNTYQYIDKTAKLNVVYYYRLEDIDLAGTRGIFTTYRLRGVITPTGKLISTWGTLKDD